MKKFLKIYGIITIFLLISFALVLSSIMSTSILWFPMFKLACYLGSNTFILFNNVSWLWMIITLFISAIGVLNFISWHYICKIAFKSTDY